MSKKKTTRTSKSNKTISAKEIKAWLKGIQEFQPEGWTPSLEQWNAIKDKIFQLEEVEAESTRVVYEPPKVKTEIIQRPATPQGPVRSPLSEVGTNNKPTVAGKAPAGEEGVVPVSSAKQVLEGDYDTPFR